jgi:hypothetical protein
MDLLRRLDFGLMRPRGRWQLEHGGVLAFAELRQ